MLTVWQKDDKVWIELRPDDLNKPFFLSPKLKSGIGEGSFYGGSMLFGDSGVIAFRRIHNQIQLVWLNVNYPPTPARPRRSRSSPRYSPSLLASAPVLSLPEPERKSILVEANSIFLADLLAFGVQLQRTYRQGYAFDARNSAITQLRQTPSSLELDVLAHYATASISRAAARDAARHAATERAALAARSAQPVPRPRTTRSRAFPTSRCTAAPPIRASATSTAVASTSATTCSARRASTSSTAGGSRRRIRPRRCPSRSSRSSTGSIATSRSSTAPSITAGILEWNKAFEKIGFKDAIRVEVQPDDADFDTLDYGRASVRWLTNAAPSFVAIGPHHADPRSGEILDADIGIESLALAQHRASSRRRSLGTRQRATRRRALDADGAAPARAARSPGSLHVRRGRRRAR